MPNLSQPDAVTQPRRLAPAESLWQLWASGLSRPVNTPPLVQGPGQNQAIISASQREKGVWSQRPNTRKRSKARLDKGDSLDPAYTSLKDYAREPEGYKTLVEFFQGHSHNSILSFCLTV